MAPTGSATVTRLTCPVCLKSVWQSSLAKHLERCYALCELHDWRARHLCQERFVHAFGCDGVGGALTDIAFARRELAVIA